MNKKIFGIIIVVLAAVLFATPVYARPEKGQKVPIVMHWTQDNYIPVVTKVSPNGAISHTTALANWSVSFDVDGVVGAWTGWSNNTEREVFLRQEEPGVWPGADMLYHEKYDFKIDGYTGGFKGSSLISMKDLFTADFMSKGHGLLIGYGDFEGQTINAGHKWMAPTEIVWTGYLLKPTP